MLEELFEVLYACSVKRANVRFARTITESIDSLETLKLSGIFNIGSHSIRFELFFLESKFKTWTPSLPITNLSKCDLSRCVNIPQIFIYAFAFAIYRKDRERKKRTENTLFAKRNSHEMEKKKKEKNNYKLRNIQDTLE